METDPKLVRVGCEFPCVRLAMVELVMDTGMSIRDPEAFGPDGIPLVHPRWLPFLPEIEVALASLSQTEPSKHDPDGIKSHAEHEAGTDTSVNVKILPIVWSEFYTVVAGEHTAMTAIVADLDAASPDPLRKPGTATSNLLNDMFEGWTYMDTPDGEFLPYVVPREEPSHRQEYQS